MLAGVDSLALTVLPLGSVGTLLPEEHPQMQIKMIINHGCSSNFTV